MFIGEFILLSEAEVRCQGAPLDSAHRVSPCRCILQCHGVSQVGERAWAFTILSMDVALSARLVWLLLIIQIFMAATLRMLQDEMVVDDCRLGEV